MHRESLSVACMIDNYRLMANATVPSLKQYKTKLKEWGLEKNIKDKDMRAIVRKDLKRKAENPSKPTKFRLRKRPVPPEKIERYKKAHSNCNEIIVADARRSYTSVRPATL